MSIEDPTSTAVPSASDAVPTAEPPAAPETGGDVLPGLAVAAAAAATSAPSITPAAVTAAVQVAKASRTSHSSSVSYVAICRARAAAEIKAFARQRESMVFTLLFPVVLLLLFATIFSNSGEIAPGTSFVRYFVAGMVAAGLLAASFQNLAIQIPIERDNGLLKRLRGTPMPKSAYFVGKVVLVLVISLIEIFLVLLLGVLFYDVTLPPDPQRWLVLIGVLVLSVAACTLLGIAFSSVPKTGSSAPAMVTPIALVLQFISGVFVVFTTLPTWLQTVGAFFPLKWMTQGVRYALLPDKAKAAEVTGEWEVGRIFLVLGAWAVVGLVLCVTTFRWRAKADG